MRTKSLHHQTETCDPQSFQEFFPKDAKGGRWRRKAFVTSRHVLPHRMVSRIVRGLQELQQGTEGDWQLSTVPTSGVNKGLIELLKPSGAILPGAQMYE